MVDKPDGSVTGRGQQRSHTSLSLVASVRFTPICEIRGDFARKGDASEFSFKWKRRRQSFPCPRMVDSVLHCCLLVVPVAFSSLSYP